MNALLTIQVRVTGNAQADAAKIKAEMSDLEASAKKAASAMGSVGSVPGGYEKLLAQLRDMEAQVASLTDRLAGLGKAPNLGQLNAQLLSIQARLAALAAAMAKVNEEGLSVKGFSGLAGMTAGVQSSLTGLAGSIKKAEDANTGWMGSLDKLNEKIVNTGKQIQWVGRQIEDAFTKPVLIAGAVGIDFALKQEKSAAQLAANYGAVGQSAQQTAGDLNLLNQAFTLLSDQYGVSKVVLNEVATDYAKAGAAGAQLAQDVKNVAQVMVISGDTSSSLATQLIGLQQAYHLNSQEMQQQIEQMVVTSKNAPGTFAQLAEAMRMSAGAAAEAGIPMGQLAALMTALTPAAGDLTTAGMAMRTIISRLANPSLQYNQLLAEMGINTNTIAWQSSTATEKLLAMAQAMNKLTPAQKAAVDSVASTRFQIDRFSVLISDLQQPLGNYAKATNDAADKQKVFAQYTKELQTVLSSNPQAFSILWNQLQNALVNIVVPLMPALEGLAGEIVRLAKAFSHLSPQTQQFVLLGLLFLAAVGPVVRYTGALLDLIGVFGKVILWPLKIAKGVGGLTEVLGGLLKFPFQTLANGFDALWGVGLTGVQTLWSGLTSLASLLAGWIGSMFTMLQTWVAGWGAVDGEIVTENAAAGAAVAVIWDTVGEDVLAVNAATVAGIAGEWAALPDLLAGEVIAPIAAEMLALPEIAGGAIVATSTEVVVAGEVVAGGFAGILATIGEAVAEAGAALVGLFGPDEIALIVAGLMALGALIYAYWGDIKNWFQDFANWFINLMVSAWGLLPQIVQDAIKGVIDVLTSSVGAIQDLLSYLNPFARHSPSLVDNVQNGLDVVGNEYSDLTGSGGVYEQAMSAHNNFMNVVSPTPSYAKQRASVVAADGPGAGAAFDQQLAAMQQLHDLMGQLTSDYDTQYTVVQNDKRALDAVALSLKTAQDNLKQMQQQASNSDAMFANSEAQKKLQLQILQLQDINGQYVDITKAAADYRGELEMLQAKAKSLRDKGAGSDVLGGIQQQISSVQGQQGDLMSRVDQMNALSTQLAGLQHQGQELSLQGAIMFDPLIRDQQKLVDSLTTSHDNLQATYDAENQKLQDLKNAYSGVSAAYTQMKQAISTASSATAGTKGKTTAAAVNFAAGALDQSTGAYGSGGSNLANLNSGNLQDLVSQWAKQAQTSFGNFDIFAPLKAQISHLKGFIHKQLNFGTLIGAAAGGAIGFAIAGPFGAVIGALAGAVIGDITDHFLPQIEGALVDAWTAAVNFLAGLWNDIWQPIAAASDAVGRALTAAWRAVWDAIGSALRTVYNDILHPIWTGIYTVLSYTIIPVLRALGIVFSTAWKDVIAPVLGLAWKVMSPIFAVMVWMWRNVLPPILQTFGEIFQIVFFGIGDILVEVWNVLVWPTLKLLWAALTNIGGIFVWLYNNVVQPTFGAIGFVVSHTWTDVISPALSGIDWFLHHVLAPTITWFHDNVISPVWSAVGTVFSAVWNEGIKPAVQALDDFFHKTLAPTFNWFKDKVVDPVFNGIGAIISGVWDDTIAFLGKGVNIAIDIFNAITGAINDIGSVIPGVTIMIQTIPQVTWGNAGGIPHHADGAVMASQVGGGFKTDGPRAIVGEGNQLHPEYVIPTDPIHRGRAMGLTQMLLRDMGVPGYSSGGPLGWASGVVDSVSSAVGGAIGDVTGAVGGAIRDVASEGFGAMADAAKAAIDPMIAASPQAAWMKQDEKQFLAGVLDDLGNWISGHGGSQAAAPPGSANAAANQALAKALHPAWASGREWNDWVLLWNQESGWNQYAKNPSSGAYGIPQALPANKMASAGSDWLTNPATQIAWGAGYIGGRYGDPVAAWAHEQKFNWYAHGGALPVRLYDSGGDLPPGLTLAMNATGKTEKVLTAEQAAGGGNRTINFYGDLSFPNIKNGDDAESFVRNLESLA